MTAGASRVLRYAPHVATLGCGYTMFAYAGVPSLYLDRYAIGYTDLGLLMSAALLGFVLVQVAAGRLVGRLSTTRVLFGAALANATLAVALDLVPTYGALLSVRFLWGGTYGLVVSVGATHIARFYSGSAASRQQGVFGGMTTLGGAVGFVAAPWFQSVGTGVGVNAGGALLVLPAVVALGANLDDRLTRPDGTASRGRGSVLAAALDRTVLLVSLCYVAIIGSYMTLSTFITVYFEDMGIVGPLNALVLLTATTGRILGGSTIRSWSVGDVDVVGGATALGIVGFGTLAVGTTDRLLTWLPFLVMLVISLPFGAVYNLAAEATDADGAALIVVIAVGNVAALVLPAVTGAVRDATGGYVAAFLLLGALNAVALGCALALARARGHPSGHSET